MDVELKKSGRKELSGNGLKKHERHKGIRRVVFLKICFVMLVDLVAKQSRQVSSFLSSKFESFYRVS